MAKIVIGNVKGKDGRGITSIKKTGTTGLVDTYTITYTDNTTSTFTIHNSDNIALQRQIVPSAAVESSAKASQAYAAGDYVVVNGLLRKVKAAIAKGNAISDSNSTATTVGGELATLGNSVSRLTSPHVFSTASTSYVPFQVNLASAILVILTTSVNGKSRGLSSTVMTAASFVSECPDSSSSMEAVYGHDVNNYNAYAYYSGGKVYLKSKSMYDSAVFIVL